MACAHRLRDISFMPGQAALAKASALQASDVGYHIAASAMRQCSRMDFISRGL